MSFAQLEGAVAAGKAQCTIVATDGGHSLDAKDQAQVDENIREAMRKFL